MALKKKIVTRISLFSFLFMLIFAAGTGFTSCSNILENKVTTEENQGENKASENENSGTETPQTEITDTKPKPREPIVISGQMNINGAVPKELLTEADLEKSGRAAVPIYKTSETEYFAVAVSGSTTVNGSFGEAGTANEKTFTLTLTPGINWTITCGIRKKNTTAEANRYLTAVMSSVLPESITEGTTLQFFPTPDTSGGADSKGLVDLSITIDSSIKAVRLTAQGSNSSSWPFATAEISGTTASIQSDNPASSLVSVPSGIYEVLFSFYDVNNTLLYATVQSISVCKGLTTSAWITSGGDSPIDSSGVFSVTAAKMQTFASTNFYIGPTGATGAADPADTNSGSHKAPFATLGRALAQIANYGVSTKDYKIHISGELKPAAADTSGFEIKDLDDKMNSLTLMGLNNNETDILDGDSRFCTLKINSAKEITVKNLTIRNGLVNTLENKNGGGIGKSGSGKLTLENCIVNSNTAENAGGGLCTFENAGDCIITNCHFESNTAGTNGGAIYSRSKTQISNTIIKHNTASASGGGCYFRDKEVTISGTQTLISENTATNNHGGGICVAVNSSLLFSEGTISENKAQLFGGGIYAVVPVTMTSGIITGNKTLGTEENFTAGGCGGGVCVKNTFTMSGGSISGNSSGYCGGGIFLPPVETSAISKVIISGTAVIGDISKDSPAESAEDKHSNSAQKGGGIFNYSGKVYIGYIDETTPDSSFSGGVGYNYTSIHGGGIYSIGSGNAEVYLNNAKLNANTAATFGGGIDTYNGTLEINNTEIKYNKADNGGGLGIGRSDGNPTCSIQNTVIQNNSAISNGAGIYLYGGNTTLSDVEITANHSDEKAAGIFFHSNVSKSLILGTSAAASTVTIKNNTAGTTNTKNNVYLTATDVITIAGALNTESEIGVSRANLPTANVLTAGFKLKNPSTSVTDIFSSDDSTYEVVALTLTGEAKLRISPTAGPPLNWFYAVGEASVPLSNDEMDRIGVPAYHNSISGTSFILDKTSSGPFYDAETNDASIFNGEIHIQDPINGVLVSAGTETTAGIPYTIAADAITGETNIFILLDIGTVYLNPETGNDDNGGFTKNMPVQTVAQAKKILKGNTKTNPEIIVMSKISDSSEISALSDLTCKDGGAASDYNGAIVKRHADFVSDSMLSIESAITLKNVTLDGGAVWTSSASQIEADSSLLTARSNASSNTGVKAGKYLVSVGASPTLNNVTIQNCDNTGGSANGLGHGAAMYIGSGTVNLNNCIIKDCSSIGGAIYSHYNGTLNATNTSFSFNLSKVTGSTAYGNGAAVYLYGGTNSGAKATFNNCSFRYNAALRNGGAVYAGNKNTVTFQNMASAVIEHNSAASNGNFMWSAASNLKLLGDFAFGTSPNQVDFYINNSSSDLKIQLGSGFGSTGTTGQALIYLAKTFEESVGTVILAPVSDDTTVDLATAKSKFALAGTDASLYEIDDNGKISPLASGGNMYTAMDYVITLSADKNQVTKGEASVVTITPTVKRTEANGTTRTLYYNPLNQKLYLDPAFNTLAAGDNTITWSALLMCGTEVEYDNLAAGTGAASNQFTIPALAWEDTYSLNVTATYMGLASDTSFTLQCVEGD